MAGSDLELAAGSISITRQQRDKTLRLIRKHGRQIGDLKALRRAGVLGTRGQLRHLLNTDETLTDEIAVARGRDPEVIRDEIRRRAIEGVVEPVFGSLGQGQGVGIVGEKRVYSDALLVMMAKGTLPEYREQQPVAAPAAPQIPVEVNGDRVTGISAVLELARQLGVGIGQGLREGLDPGPALDALPAAREVRPDPLVGEPAAGAVAAPRPA